MVVIKPTRHVLAHASPALPNFYTSEAGVLIRRRWSSRSCLLNVGSFVSLLPLATQPIDAMMQLATQVAQVHLALPCSFAQLGFVSGVVFQIFYGVVGCWSCYLITFLYVEYRTRREREGVTKNHVIQVLETSGSCLQLHLFAVTTLTIPSVVAVYWAFGDNVLSLFLKTLARDIAVVFMLVYQFITVGFAITKVVR